MDLFADARVEMGRENCTGIISRLSGERRGKERVGFVFRRKYAGKEKPFGCFLRLSNRAYRNGEIFIKRAGEGVERFTFVQQYYGNMPSFVFACL